MNEYIRADKQLLVAIFGISTSLLTGIVLGLIEVYIGIAVYSFMLWFVIPGGAFLSGFGAASGYYAGAMLFNQKPVGGVLFNMIAASISAFLVVHYVPYYMMEVGSIRIKDALSFWQYIDLDIRHTSLSLIRSQISTGELGGSLGYIYAGLQLIGFSFGGFAVFGWLSQNPYCDKCSMYLKKTGNQNRFTSDGDALVDKLVNFSSLIGNNDFDKAILFHAEEMGVNLSGSYKLRTKLITRECPGCGLNHLYFVASKLEGDNWKDITQTEIRLFTNSKLHIPQ